MLGSTLVGACVHADERREPPRAAAPPARDDDAPPLPPVFAVAERAARERLQPFGLAPTAPVLIEIARSRADFEERTGQRDPLLRAWTELDVITFAPLVTWADRSPAAVIARLTHELCHAAIAQRFGTRERVRAARVPRFFEEGACSVAADQGDVRLPLDDVRARAPADVLSGAAFVRDAPLAYAAAHHLMDAVWRAHGDTVFSEILASAAKDGSAGCVERALEARLGRSVDETLRAVLAAQPGAS